MNTILARVLTLLFSCVTVLSLFAWEDLEERKQDFVLETKKLDIKGYPDAFNPSIIRWRGKLLLCFRFRYPENQLTDGMGFTWLNEDFSPVGKPQVLDRTHDTSVPYSRAQDPHLIEVAGRLYIVYSNVEDMLDEGKRRVFIAEITFDHVRFAMNPPECLSNFPGKIDRRIEKNWVPFNYNGQLLLAYSIHPHRIFYPVWGEKKCELLSATKGDIKWNWGEIRGGTPALIDNGEYLAFFHSSKEMKTVHSNGQKHSHYFMGAYTFSHQPPFEITKISPEPIIGKNFYKGPVHQTWKPLWCVFPGGFVFNKDYVWIAYGRQDHEVWIVKIDKQKLLNHMIPVYSSLQD